MKKILVSVLVLVLVVALALPTTVIAAPDTVDFEGLTTGASVTGLGNAGQADLDIQSTSPDDLVVIEELDATYHVYSGNNTSNNDTINAGLTGVKGFGDPDRDDAELGWEATFNGKTVSSFSIDMLDYGDWFPQMANFIGEKTHTAALIAYDASDIELGRSVLTFHSTGTGSTSRNSTEYGFLGDTGDVLEANGGNTNPGLWTFSLVYSGINRIEMWFDGSDSADPGVGWDNIVFEMEEDEPLITNLCAGQDIDIGNTIVTNDGTTLFVTYEITEPGWLITKTHLYVGKNIPPTSSPGQFPYNDSDAVSVTNTMVTYEIPLDDIDNYSMKTNKKGKSTGVMVADDAAGVVPGDPIYVAAHAEVIKVEGDCQDPFWATNYTSDNQGDGWDNAGNPVAVEGDRSNPMAVTGQPDAYSSSYGIGFFSLGEGGDITVDFGYPIFNNTGDYDISVHEISGNRGDPTEDAEVYVIVDGDEYFAGYVSSSDQGNGIGTISIPAQFTYVDAVKIVDTTDKALHVPRYTGDGYDIDAVDACFLVVQEETAWGGACDEENYNTDINPEGFVFFFNPDGKGNWASYFEYTIQ